MLKANPPQNVNKVLLKPWINAATDAKAHKDQITPGMMTANANKLEKGSSINCKTFNKIRIDSTIVIQINASKNFPFPLKILPPTVIITENTIIWKT